MSLRYRGELRGATKSHQMSEHPFGQRGAMSIALACASSGAPKRSEREVNRSVATRNKVVDPAGRFESESRPLISRRGVVQIS